MSEMKLDIKKILETVNLVDVVNKHLVLEKKGERWYGLCPFHKEKSPSFEVRQDYYNCYGCGQHGDAIDWLRNIEGMSFAQAIRKLGGNINSGPSSDNEGRLPHVDMEARILQCRARLPHKHLVKAIAYSRLGNLSKHLFLSILPRTKESELDFICDCYGFDPSTYLGRAEALLVWEHLAKTWTGYKSS